MFSLLSALPIIGKLFETVTSITNKLGDIKVAQINATTQQERDRLAAQSRELEAKRDVMIAQSKTPAGQVSIWIQNLLGLAVVIILWKIVVWDQALGQWTGGFTHALGKDVWDFIKIATGFYFVTTWFKG